MAIPSGFYNSGDSVYSGLTATIDSPVSRPIFRGSKEISPKLAFRYRQFAREPGPPYWMRDQLLHQAKPTVSTWTRMPVKSWGKPWRKL